MGGCKSNENTVGDEALERKMLRKNGESDILNGIFLRLHDFSGGFVMSVEKVKSCLARVGMEHRLTVFEVSSATVELAAKALGVEAARIAKSISFYDREDGCLLIVTAGDGKIDNAKFKAEFGYKAKMLSRDDVERLTGYRVGGVCPFDNPPEAKVYCDVSLKRFDWVYPAGGSDNSCVKLTCDELFRISGAVKWIDVCKSMEGSATA